ncbi:RDD family protein [Neolewinella aurantiaca]|uniref:RDD family protein n=1 Tax=Neolewinella aurantiaca TaxID=2602767 RepID=A0A5C7FPD7_9BACT|nr:RDD family protein [Neolewinella aurantiaca]TXF89558.1 RDD family protein [Neolewinella aurantiaca]
MESVTIQTTQNVRIDYELAKAGSRMGAFFIDAIVFTIAYWILSMLLINFMDSLDDFAIIAFGSVFSFLGYYFLLELFNRGQTLGKKVVGLRVIRLDGRDPTPADFLTRSIFLLPDVILSSGIPAMLLISSGRHNQRLGDMVAGTVVIQTAISNTFTLEEIMGITRREDHEPEFPGVQRFTNHDMMVVKRTLQRSRQYGNPAHKQAVRKLAIRIADELELDKKEVKYTPEKFLDKVLLDFIVLTR